MKVARFTFLTLALWFFVISNINVYDDEAQRAFSLIKHVLFLGR